MGVSGPSGTIGTAARTVAWLVAALALAVVALAQDGGGQAGNAESVGVSSGVFSEEQAAAGADVFARRCAGCHGGELGGGFGPRLAPLSSYWPGRSLAELFSFVSGNMPFDSPGSLSAEEYAQVVAFVLSRNGYPAGEADLAADAEALAGFVIDAPDAE